MNRRERKAQTAQAILDAARKVFGSVGYEGAKIRDIAAEAGYSTGGLFACYATKAQLFFRVYGRDAPDIRGYLAQRADIAKDHAAQVLMADLWGPIP